MNGSIRIWVSFLVWHCYWWISRNVPLMTKFPNEIIDIGSLCSKRGSLLAQIQALNWPSWELRCHAWALCHMWVFESLLLHFWASYWFPQTLAKSTESSSSISHPSTCLSNILGVLSHSSSLFNIWNPPQNFCLQYKEIVERRHWEPIIYISA